MHEENLQIKYADKNLLIATKYKRNTNDWIVFLHGLGCAKESFDGVFTDELAQEYSILTFDFVGFGKSDKPDNFSYRLEDHAEIARCVIEQVAPGPVIIVAHSMGGTIGLLLAQGLKNLVSFVNVEGNLLPEDAGIVSRQTAEQDESVFVQEGFDKFLVGLQNSSDTAFRAWATSYKNSSPIALHRSGTSLVEWSDSGKLLSYFNGLNKKAFVHGDRTDVSLLSPQLLDVDIYSIPDGGHFMMLDNPAAFYAAIRNHLLS
ncbi:MAG: alpha/beta hydrolase [Candidatus Saccharimonadales bacterium]